ncbi:MAG: FtsX-like permease family protein, partial [Kiritimatiellia bacterium]|nr:FtsX-like permease family protein [Kiritimatiellia bacterium]
MNPKPWIGGIGRIGSILTLAGCAGAAILLTWVAGYTLAALAQRQTLAEEMTGPYDSWLSSARAGIAAKKGFGVQELVPGSPFALIPPKAIDAIRSQPWVDRAESFAVFRMRVRYEGFQGAAEAKVPPLSAGVACEDGQRTLYRNELAQGRWLDEKATLPEAVVAPEMFLSRGLRVPRLGEMLEVSSFAGVADVKVVGLLRNRQTVSGFPTLFVPTDVFYGLMPDVEDGGSNLLLCQTRRYEPAADLREAVVGAVGDKTPVRALDRQRLVAELSGDLLKNMVRQAPLMLTLAFLTALCLTGTAVRIGVAARMGTFGLCRVIGMTGRQAAGLVRRETGRLCVRAWAVGFPLGVVLLYIFVGFHREAFPDGVPFRAWFGGAIFSALGLSVSGHLAVMGPCRRLRRMAPLEALGMSVEREVFRGGSVLISLLMMGGVLGLLWAKLPAWLLSGLILFVGLPVHLWGLWRLLPHVAMWGDRLCAKWISPLLAGAAGRSALRTRSLILTVGVGLGSYCAVQIWGASMMEPFLPSVSFPDVVASFEPNGIQKVDTNRFRSLDGVSDALWLNARQFVLTPETLSHIERAAGATPPQNNILLIGLERLPKRFEAVVSRLGQGECIIPAMLARQGGFVHGDTISLRRVLPDGREISRSWKVAGVLNLNWHLVTARAGMRGLDGAPFGTLGPVFVRADEWNAFTTRRPGCGEVGYLWFDLKPSARFEDVERLFTRTVAQLPRREGQALPGQPRTTTLTPTVTLHRRDEISEGTLAHGAELIGELAAIPFWSLVLLLFGVAAVTQANIDSRRREFALLRAIGQTQNQLRRQLLQEVLLLLTLGALASLFFGLCIGWLFTAWTRAWLPFGGLPIVLRIPWRLLGEGIALTYLVGLLYAWFPIRRL